MPVKTPKKVRGIYERPAESGIWWISYTDSERKRRREKVGTRGSAIALYRVRKTEVLTGKKLTPANRRASVTFGELATAALAYSRRHHRDAKKVAQRLAILNKTSADRDAAEIRPAEIDRWLASNTDTPATTNRYRALLSMVYREGIRNEQLTTNPARLVPLRRESNGRVRYLQPDEEQRLIKVLTEKFPEFLPEFTISVKSGMRLSEQYGLQWKEIDFKRREIRLDKTKNGTARNIPMSAAVYDAFVQRHQACADRQPTGRVFEFLSHGERFQRALREAGVGAYTWHCNRHTFCSRLAENNASISSIQALVGHKTIAMSASYTHMSNNTLATEIAKLG